jgi:hypothetical protein
MRSFPVALLFVLAFLGGYGQDGEVFARDLDAGDALASVSFAPETFSGGNRPLPVAPVADSASTGRRVVASTWSEVDGDYGFQGEYTGSIEVGMAGGKLFGLQVVAGGNGTFTGRFLGEGLPGAGWNKVAAIPCQGLLNEGRVTLTSSVYVATIDAGGRAEVRYNRGGKSVLGTLRKVERVSPTLGAKAPCDAIVLFDGSSTSQFLNAKVTPEGCLAVGTETLGRYQDFTLHLEFRTPYMPSAKGQARGNSGVYIQGRYEVQILDSFGLEGEFNECASLYRTRKPDLNMAFPPLAWQTYDITFQAARFGTDGRKCANARITVCHNGVVVHNDVEIPNKTGGGLIEGPSAEPIKLQNHNDPVTFRNIWIVDHCAPKPCVPCCVECVPCRKCRGRLFGAVEAGGVGAVSADEPATLTELVAAHGR